MDVFPLTGHINKTRVPKEAQDDALSNGTTGDRQTSTGRPTRGDVVRIRRVVTSDDEEEMNTTSLAMENKSYVNN